MRRNREEGHCAPRAASAPTDRVDAREARQRRLFQAIRVVNDETSSLRGAAFFDSLTERLADVLAADVTFVGQLSLDRTSIDIVSLRADGKKALPFSYALAGTPCAQVVENRTHSYSKDVVRLFPEDAVLAELGIHAYVGVPLRDAANVSIGILVGLFRHDLDHAEFAESVLLFFGPRVALEIQQARSDKMIQQRDQALEAALDDAQRANGSKDRFLAMLSHELRTPLSSISMAVQILQHIVPGDPRVHNALGIIDRSANHQARLVDDLLDLGRIERGLLRIARAPVELHKLLGDVLRDVEEDARRGGVQVEAVLEPNQWVDADATRINQIALNMLSNALKFTPIGGRVTVRLERRRDKVRLTVEDTGPGIDPELLPRLFTPFTQGPGANGGGARQVGLGIGLSIVRSLAVLHGGAAWAESEGRSRGSRVIVELPAIAPPVQLRSAPLDAGRILLVEDDPDAREMLSASLEMLGHSVVSCATGAEALGRLAGARADVILADLGLPDIDGCDLLRRMRSVEGYESVPAVAVTAFGQPEDRLRTREAGFVDHMVKPVELRTLAARVRELVAEQRAEHPVSPI